MNELTGEESTYFGADLPIGLDNRVRPGAFYRNIFDMSYKCEKVNDDGTATMMAFLDQHGQHLEARLVIGSEYADRYVEITDPTEIAPLEIRHRACLQADEAAGRKGRPSQKSPGRFTARQPSL